MQDKLGKDHLSTLGVHLEERFDFAVYLALNIHEGVWDSIRFHPYTWTVLLVFVVLVSIG